jgi:hypothetical protein
VGPEHVSTYIYHFSINSINKLKIKTMKYYICILYISHLSPHLLLNYMISLFFFFERINYMISLLTKLAHNTARFFIII